MHGQDNSAVFALRGLELRHYWTSVVFGWGNSDLREENELFGAGTSGLWSRRAGRRLGKLVFLEWH